MQWMLRYLDRLCLCLLIVLSLAAGGLCVFFSVREYKQIRFENELLVKKKQELSLAELNLSQVKAVMGKTRSELKRLNERIPETAKIGGFLKQVHELSLARRIKLIRLQHLPAVEVKRYSRIPVLLMVEGRFNDIYLFVRDLETMNRICIFDRLLITKPGSAKICRAELRANVFKH